MAVYAKMGIFDPHFDDRFYKKKKNDYIFLVLMIHKKPHLEKRLPGMLLFVKDDGKRIKSGSKRDQRKNLQTP